MLYDEKIRRAAGRAVLSNMPIILFLFSQSISVICAKDVGLFWKSYHNLLISILIFFKAALLFGKRRNLIVRFLFLVAIITTGLEVALYLVPKDLFRLLPFQSEILDAFIVNLDRNRFSFESHNEFLLLVLLFVSFTSLSKKRRFVGLIISVVLIALSFYSSNRTRLISLMGALIFFIVSFFHLRFINHKGRSANIVFTLIAAFVFVFILFPPRAMFERIFAPSESSDYETIIFRIDSIKHSALLLQSSPLLGVGLGNYPLYPAIHRYVPPYEFGKSAQNRYDKAVPASPHNIFAQVGAETGIVGLGSFVFLIFWFIRKDVEMWRKGKDIKMVLSFCSWIIFLTFLFNPSHTLYISGWFWFLRGVIYSKNHSIPLITKS